MGGFTDADYGDRRTPRHRGGRWSPPDAPVQSYTSMIGLTRAEAEDPERLDMFRHALAERTEATVAAQGYRIDAVTWDSVTTSHPAVELMLHLTATLRPRTDGVWPSVHAAIAEDQADREAAERTARPSTRMVFGERPPVDPLMGDMWFDYADGITRIWDGDRWLRVATPEPDRESLDPPPWSPSSPDR